MDNARTASPALSMAPARRQGRGRRWTALSLPIVLTAGLAVGPGTSGVGYAGAATAPAPAAAVEPPPGRIVPSTPNFGWVKGDFAVSHGGSAQYTIPLWMPPGRGSLHPDLALSYSSGGDNGPLGVGWSLQGLSSVTPCRRTVAQDGSPGGIRYDASDVYCLDGNRLWPAGSHTGTQQEYRTERETFARVIAYGAANAVPSHFKVWRKDGRILTLGETDASRLRARRLTAGPDPNSPTLVPSASPVTAAWSLSKMEDRNGNVATVGYLKSSLGNAQNLWGVEMRPQTITYGPNRRVLLGYVDREDPSDSFTGGVHTRSSQVLDTITMEGGPEGGARQVLRRYRLAYHDEGTSVTGRSLLASVTECDAADACLRPVTFTWSPGSTQFEVINTLVSRIGPRIVAGDVDGNGRDDLLHLQTCAPDDGCDRNRWSVRRSVGSGGATFGSHELTGIPQAREDDDYRNDVRPIDLDADGRLDVMVEVNVGGAQGRSEYKPFRSTGTGYTDHTDLTPLHDSRIDTDLPYFLDLDGNGAADFVMPMSFLPASQRFHYRLGTGGGAFSALTDSLLTSPRGPSARMQTLDHDGDGRSSLLVPNADANPHHFLVFGLSDDGTPTLRRDSAAGVNLPFPADSDPRDLHLADVNGDGLRDAVYPLSGLRTQLSTGRGFSPMIPGPPGYSLPPMPLEKDTGIRIADFTNDGADDVMLLLRGEPTSATDTQHGVQLYTWRGGGFQRVAVNAPNGLGAGIYHQDSGMSSTQPLDVDGDGVLELVRLRPADGPSPQSIQILKRTGGQPDLMTAVDVTDGPRVEVGYTTLANRAVHQPASSSCGFPLTCPTRGGVIVAEHRYATHTADEPFDRYRHTYQGARTDVQGRGWLGFAEHKVSRALDLAATVTTFDNVTRDAVIGGYPLAHLPKTVTFTVFDRPGGRLYRRTVDNTYVPERIAGRRHTVELRNVAETEEERPEGSQTFERVRRRTTATEYDGFGNRDLVTTATEGGRRTVENPTFRNDTTSWLIGLPTSTLTTGCTAANTCRTRESTFDYDDRGNRFLEIVEPNRPDRPELKLTTRTAYGPFGVVTSVTRTPAAGPARTENLEYNNEDKLHPTDTINAAGHRVTVVTHTGLGVQLSSTGPNPGQKTTMRYDGFGRLRETHRSDGSFELVTHKVAAGTQTVTTDVSGGGRTAIVRDQLDRVVQEQTKTFDGSTAIRGTTYDARGNPITTSRPALPGASLYLTTTEYDQRDRPVRITEPDDVVTRHEYAGRETHTYDGKGVHRYQVATVDGDVGVSFEDDPASTAWLETRFAYGPFGETTRITAPDDTVQTMEHDVLGRLERQVDPSSGTTVRTYNGFGEVTTETNGAGEVTEHHYDLLGRIERTVSPDGTATNTWDTAANGKGMLATARSAEGVVKTHTYDDVSRPATVTWTVDGVGYAVGYGYDGIGRPSTIDYPAVPGATGSLKVVNGYNPHGYLATVSDAAQGGATYWTAQERDPAGQLTRERYHNGVVTEYRYEPETGLLDGSTATGPGTIGVLANIGYDYDDNRNVTDRHDTVDKRWEQYHYDELNRLIRWNTQVPAQGYLGINATYRYDSVGNLTAESFQRQGKPRVDVTYGYDENGPRPHALISRNSATYGYDLAGRQTSGGGRGTAYNRLNLPTALNWGQGQRTEFDYDADGARVLKRDAGQTVVTVGGLFERRTPAGTDSTQIHNLHNILVEGRIVAQVNRVQDAAGGPVVDTPVQYLIADRQRSTVTITNGAGRRQEPGNFLAALYYDPFGRRVDANYEPLGTQRHGGPRQGYTGHVHDDEFGLIDMKGRIYSPEDRRFLTADPIIQDPLRGQSHNRYAYVWNNPATRVDPTGFQSCLVPEEPVCVPTGDEVSALDEQTEAETYDVGQSEALECVAAESDDTTDVAGQALTSELPSETADIDGDLGDGEEAVSRSVDALGADGGALGTAYETAKKVDSSFDALGLAGLGGERTNLLGDIVDGVLAIPQAIEALQDRTKTDGADRLVAVNFAVSEGVVGAAGVAKWVAPTSRVTSTLAAAASVLRPLAYVSRVLGVAGAAIALTPIALAGYVKARETWDYLGSPAARNTFRNLPAKIDNVRDLIGDPTLQRQPLHIRRGAEPPPSFDPDGLPW